MNEKFDFENPKEGIDKWIIGYKYKSKLWSTIEIPGFLSKETIENILIEINDLSDIVFSRVVMGVTEPKRHIYKKGDFLGL